MHTDSQHGLTIDLAGPDGNAFALMGYARRYAKQIPGKDSGEIIAEMMLGDYDHLLDVFEREFGSVITLINKPGEFPATNICPECAGDGHYLGDECEYCYGTGEIFE